MARIKQYEVKLTGIAPVLLNRDSIMLEPEFKKQREETYEEYEQRVWKEKAYVDKDENVFFPAIWFRRACQEIAKQWKIKPNSSVTAKNAHAGNLFRSVFFPEDVYPLVNGQKVKKDDLKQFNAICNGTPGSAKPSKVPKIRPAVSNPWEAIMSFQVTDDSLKIEAIIETLERVGAYNGIGDWRIQNNGQCGRFQVELIK